MSEYETSPADAAETNRHQNNYKADFLWPPKEGSAEEAGYEFVNAGTEEGRKQWWEILKSRLTPKERLTED